MEIIGYARRLTPVAWDLIRRHLAELADVGVSEAALQDAGQHFLEAVWLSTDATEQEAAIARVWETLRPVLTMARYLIPGATPTRDHAASLERRLSVPYR
jgi:hypothetical protein